jgi:hypothetical protein
MFTDYSSVSVSTYQMQEKTTKPCCMSSLCARELGPGSKKVMYIIYFFLALFIVLQMTYSKRFRASAKIKRRFK